MHFDDRLATVLRQPVSGKVIAPGEKFMAGIRETPAGVERLDRGMGTPGLGLGQRGNDDQREHDGKQHAAHGGRGERHRPPERFEGPRRVAAGPGGHKETRHVVRARPGGMRPALRPHAATA